MEQAQGTEQVSTETMTTTVDSTSQAESQTPVTSSAQGTSEVTQSLDGQSQPTYKADFKFWAEQKEHEVPEWLRDKIKDAESEKQVKEILQKAYGLDHVKSIREQIKGEFKTYKEQAEPTLRTVQQASQSYQRAIGAFKQGNMASALFNMESTFQSLGIPEQVVQQYVLQKLKAQDADPAVKDAYNRQRDIESQYLTQQSQLEQVQTQYQQIMVQQRTQELSQALSRPEVASIVQSFDQRNGQGAFQAEVIRQAQLHYQQTKQDISAQDMVNQIIQRYGFTAPAPQSQPTQQGPGTRELPVIPVAKGGSKSPSGQAIQSTDDMRKAYERLTSQT